MDAHQAEKGFVVHFIDVGQADAALIVCDGVLQIKFTVRIPAIDCLCVVSIEQPNTATLYSSYRYTKPHSLNA